MIGVSGCFGRRNGPDPIDDLAEAADTVNDIMGDAPEADPQGQPQGQGPDLAAAQVLGQYVRRVRLLTWAVVAVAIYLVMKEL